MCSRSEHARNNSLVCLLLRRCCRSNQITCRFSPGTICKSYRLPVCSQPAPRFSNRQLYATALHCRTFLCPRRDGFITPRLREQRIAQKGGCTLKRLKTRVFYVLRPNHDGLLVMLHRQTNHEQMLEVELEYRLRGMTTSVPFELSVHFILKKNAANEMFQTSKRVPV